MTMTMTTTEATRQTATELTLREIVGEEDQLAVERATLDAGSACIAPTHIVLRGEKVVGYASLNAVPIITGWLHDDRVSQAEGHAIIEQLEIQARKQGLPFLCLPCTPDCRFKPDMHELGYRQSKTVTFYLKKLE